MNCGFLMEKKPETEAPELAGIFKANVLCCQNMLNKFRAIFPDYTDHSALHSLEVIAFANQLIAALIRLADELDIAADRSLLFMYDTDEWASETSRREFAKHKAIRFLDIEEERFCMRVHADSQQNMEDLLELKGKVNETLTYCREVAEKRTPFRITQKKVDMISGQGRSLPAENSRQGRSLLDENSQQGRSLLAEKIKKDFNIRRRLCITSTVPTS